MSNNLNIFILKTEEEKTRGLMGVSKFPKDTLFLFDDVLPNTFFHTRNCLLSLDIVPISGDGTILAIYEVDPWQSQILMPLGTKKVIETHKGWFRSQGLGVGVKFLL